MNRPWVTLFSQTGSEIYNISKKINRVPDVIITNKPKDKFLEIKPELFDEYGDRFVWLSKKPTVEEYIEAIPLGSFVTLHGWLRIIPPEICEAYEIYNLHPAPLKMYPHLKGKDPQIRIWQENLEYTGNTIHKCTAELDAGEILVQNLVPLGEWKFDGLNEIFKITHEAATELWCGFLQNRV